MAIPTTLHQLWKTEDVPSRYTALRETWRRRNPSWDFRLWTDRDLLDLVATRYPELLEMFRAYPLAICRADLGRYLILEAFGGVYADLDCECLRPLGPLLAGVDFAIGLEPDEHHGDGLVARSGLERILCPSFIASAPSHPFWGRVREQAVEAFGKGDVLDQTGPFMLTRAYEGYGAPSQIALLPARLVYPFTKFQCWNDRVYDLEVWERTSREAFVAHYWEASWFRPTGPIDGLPRSISAKLSATPATPAVYPDEVATTRITCLTAADGWTQGLSLAIESYLRQTHPNKELVIVCSGVDSLLGERLENYRRRDIRLVAVPDRSLKPAELRTMGAEAASGALICRWDAGELQDPRRLEIQLRVLRQAGAHASVLSRRLEWRPASRKMVITAEAPRLDSLLCQKSHWPQDETESVGALRDLAAVALVASIDLPRLTLKVAVEADADSFAAAWSATSARFEGERCDAVIEHIGKRLPIDLARREPSERRPLPRAHRAVGEVLILTPIKDGRRHLPRYMELLSRLDSGGAPLSVAFMEGDSRDGSFEALEAALPSLAGRFARVETYRHDDGLHLEGPRWAPSVQRERRANIAKARNRLLGAALAEAEWVLWLDVDVIDYPPDLLTRLLAAHKDIVVPHCMLPSGRTFNLNTFIFAPGGSGRDDPRRLLDGLYQPPRGEGRLYLEDVADQDLVRVDSVGGTALLVRAELHREGLNFPAYSYGGYIETEGLAMMARDMGHQCWALPQLHIVHSNDADGA
jgi:glycosyltransferase involved in cell wall biosynthesis